MINQKNIKNTKVKPIIYMIIPMITVTIIKMTKAITLMKTVRARSLVVSDLRSETKGSRFESGC